MCFSSYQPASPVEYCYIRPADPFPEGKTPIGIETKHLNKAPLISEGLKKVGNIKLIDTKFISYACTF